MKQLFTLFFVGLFVIPFAEAQTGEIQGKVTNQRNEALEFANVLIFKNEIEEAGTVTDENGFYSVPGLSAGTYDVTSIYFGNEVTIANVVVSNGKVTFLDPIVISDGIELGTTVIEYEAPLVDLGNPSSGSVTTAEDIQNSGLKSVSKIVATTASVYLRKDNDNGINIAGARTDGTVFMIDGVRVPSSFRLPSEAIEQVNAITGGVEAKNGDGVGGFVSTSTKGPSKNLLGSVELITSEFLDGYGHNYGNFFLTGPLMNRFKGTDSAKTVLGFMLTASAQRTADDNASVLGVYKVKDDKMNEIRSQPLIPSPLGVGLLNSSEFLTMDDLEKIKARQNAGVDKIDVFGRLDWKLGNFSNLTLGGSFNYTDRQSNIYTFSLLNPEHNPQVISQGYFGYLRFTQRFLKKALTDENAEQEDASILGNAHYSIQADYRKTLSTTQDIKHKDDYWKYSYIGQFNTVRGPIYGLAADTVSGWIANVQQGNGDLYTIFNPGGYNPLMEQLTWDVYDFFGTQTNVFEIAFNQGAINGSNLGPEMNTFSMWYNPGANYTSYGKSDADQFGLRLDAGVDLKNPKQKEASKHAIEIGFQYLQSVSRGWSVGPRGAWNVMRNLTNNHIDLDRGNPIVRINGVDYTYDELISDPYAPPVGINDTIYYNIISNADQQTYFDQQLRQSLGLGATDWINVDNLTPEQLDLQFFKPDDLIQNGLVSYNGFDIYGNKLNSQPAFSDYFLEQDDSKIDPSTGEGIFTRPIGAFRPIYTAAYIQDRFNFQKIIFRAGLRVDRYDANRMVMKDKYSLYDVKTVAEVNGNMNQDNDGAHPANIGDDYKVYVDDVTNPDKIVGYRNGDDWFNSEGVEIVDPRAIAAKTSTGTISPFLVDPTQDIKDPSTYDPDGSFEDYKPQISVMPRLAFSFPITDVAQFTAHYDVLTQRPKSNSNATPRSYYFLPDGLATLNNPNLKPEKTIEYQVGFEQQLGDDAKISISAYYRELRDLIQLRALDYAYPIAYNTYDNFDFGNVKGLTLGYLTRRLGNVKLSANYTLQFAEGTGSSASSSANLVDAGQPNLRTIIPLNFDSRHTVNFNIDYRFGIGDNYNGPMIKDNPIFANAGANLTFRARSGEPFTKQAQAAAGPEGRAQSRIFGARAPASLDGSINGSRLPWNYKIDLKVDKTFTLFKEKERSLPITAYLLVQNLLNTKNTIVVYEFTGLGDDDGYLSSPSGQTTANGTVSPESFIDLYTIKMQNPANFDLARRIHFGLQFGFGN